MPRARIVAVVTLILVGLAPLRAALQLRGEVDGRVLALVAVERSRLMVEHEGTKSVAPPGATWILDGDLAAQAHYGRWAPDYRIARASEAEARLRPDTPFRATVSLQNRTSGSSNPAGLEQPVWDDWPNGIADGAALAVAWWLDGAVRQLVVTPLSPADAGQEFRTDVVLWLTEDEARGQPVVLLWQDGAWVAPAPMFADAATQDAALAVWLDDVPRLTAALAAGAQLGASSRSGNNLGGLAAEAGSQQVLPLLHRARPSLLFEKDRDRRSPFFYAAHNRRLETLQWLLATPGTKAAYKSQLSHTWLAAIRNGHADVVTELQRRFAPLDPKTLPADACDVAIRGGYPDLPPVILAAGVPWTISPDDNTYLLGETLRQENWACAHFVLTRPIDPRIEPLGLPPMHWAASHGNAELAEKLFAAGAKAQPAGSFGFTPLMRAAESGNVAFGRVLLQHGADPNVANKESATALHLAANSNAAAFVELLLAHGARIDATMTSKLTALDVALLIGAGDAARTLCAAGARIDLGSARAVEMLESALRNDLPEPLAAAIADGWDIDSLLSNRWPPLCLARVLHATRCEEVLVAAGANESSLQPCPVVTPSEVDQPVSLVTAVRPRDPRRHEETFPAQTVQVDFIIDPEGRASFPRILSSADSRLGVAVLEALPQWQFAPPTREGEAVAVRATMPLNFPASTDRVVETTTLRNPPKAIRTVEPVYPSNVQDPGANVSVVASVLVRWDGRASDARVASASHPGFDGAALQCVRKWEFQPGDVSGQPVNARTQVTIVFKRPKR